MWQIVFYLICSAALLKMRRTTILIFFVSFFIPLLFGVSFIVLFWVCFFIDKFLLPINLYGNIDVIFTGSFLATPVVYFVYFLYQEVVAQYYESEHKINILRRIIQAIPAVLWSFNFELVRRFKTAEIPEYSSFYFSERKEKDIAEISLEVRNLYLSRKFKNFYILGFILFSVVVFSSFGDSFLENDESAFGNLYSHFISSAKWYIKFTVCAFSLGFLTFLYVRLYNYLDESKLKK